MHKEKVAKCTWVWYYYTARKKYKEYSDIDFAYCNIRCCL